MDIRIKITFDRALMLGILASLAGGIPVVIIMNAVGMFEKLAEFLGLGDSLVIGIAIHLVISFVYGLPLGAAVYYLQNYRYPKMNSNHLNLWVGFAWGIITWVIAFTSMPMVMSGEAFFLGFNPVKIFTATYLRAIAISLVGHLLYGFSAAGAFTFISKHWVSVLPTSR